MPVDPAKIEQVISEIEVEFFFEEVKGYSYPNDARKNWESSRPKLETHITEVISFIQDCKIEILKPQVMRVNKSSWTYIFDTPSIKHEYLYVRPQMSLTYKDKTVLVCNPAEIDKDMAFIKGIDSFVRLVGPFPHDILHQYFSEEISRIKEIRKIILDEYERVKREASTYVKEFRSRRSASEKRKFQKKLGNLMEKFPNLVDVDPNTLLSFMVIEEDDIQAIKLFAKRNRADAFIADADDVLEAQKIGRTAAVLKS